MPTIRRPTVAQIGVFLGQKPNKYTVLSFIRMKFYTKEKCYSNIGTPIISLALLLFEYNGTLTDQ